MSDNVVVNSTSIQFSWSAVTSDITVLKYQVSYQRITGASQMGCDYDGSETDGTSGTRDVDSTVTEYTLTGLEEFSTYDVSVAAVNVFGPSELSTVQITTDLSGEDTGCCSSVMSE